MIFALTQYIERIGLLLPSIKTLTPWRIIQDAEKIIRERMTGLEPDYKTFNNVAIHKTATIDDHAQLKGPAIISQNCFIGANTLLRGGVFLDENVSVGPGCEVKSAFIFSDSALAHFNFVGDSLVGAHVNLEAGAVIANHYNERKDKAIFVCLEGQRYATGLEKFGALIGDHCKLGANSVLSPGTILKTHCVVRRLELVEQCPPLENER